MEEQETTVIEQNSQSEAIEMTSEHYIEELNNVKKNMIPRELYDKALNENKTLANQLTNGLKDNSTEELEPVADLTELRNKMFGEELSNLEYWQNAVAIRKELLKSGKRDPWVPYGENINPTIEDYESADRVQQVVEECIDYAKGDSVVFTNELQRRTNDVRIRR